MSGAGFGLVVLAVVSVFGYRMLCALDCETDIHMWSDGTPFLCSSLAVKCQDLRNCYNGLETAIFFLQTCSHVSEIRLWEYSCFERADTESRSLPT